MKNNFPHYVGTNVKWNIFQTPDIVYLYWETNISKHPRGILAHWRTFLTSFFRFFI